MSKERPLVYAVVVAKEKQKLFEDFIRANTNKGDLYIDLCTTYYEESANDMYDSMLGINKKNH